MTDVVDRIGSIVPIFVIASIGIFTIINIILKIRQKFPSKVNCWFCNGWTSVSYKQKNCWTCPQCDQYNGFSEDGDYNCDIPAQRVTKLNGLSILRPKKPSNSYSPQLTNGFCAPCNRNQEIKTQQLATFVPNDEANYDEEIDEYRKKLEQAYRLCYRCERILKRTLNSVKRNILGAKLSQIGSTGLRIFDLHMSSRNSLLISKKRQMLIHFGSLVFLGISALNLISTAKSVTLTKSNLDILFHARVTNFVLITLSYIAASQLLISKTFDYLLGLNAEVYSEVVEVVRGVFPTSITVSLDLWPDIKGFLKEQYDSQLVFDFTALLLVIMVLLLNGLHGGSGIIWLILLWSLKMLLPTVNFNSNEIFVDILKLSLGIIIVIISIINIKKNSPGIKLTAKDCTNLNDSFHRIYTECDSEEDSEVDSLSTSKQSPTQLNYSRDSGQSSSPLSLSGLVPQRNISQSPDTFGSSLRSNYLQRNQFRGSQDSLFSTNHSGIFTANLQTKLPNDFNKFTAKKCTSMVHGINSCDSETFENGPIQLNVSSSNGFLPLLTPPSHTIQPPRQRNPLILPSRLNLKETVVPQSLTQASWVAGGYWNSTSPTKKPQMLLLKEFPDNEHDLLVSPTSSQSSGFESRASSVINGCDNNRSRDSSICRDVDRNTILFEIPELTNNAELLNATSKCLNNHGPKHKSELDLSQQYTSSLSHRRLDGKKLKNADVFNEALLSNEPISAFPLRHHHSWKQQQQQHALRRASSTCSFNFKKLTNDLPLIEKGDLLRSWKQNSLLNLTQNL